MPKFRLLRELAEVEIFISSRSMKNDLGFTCEWKTDDMKLACLSESSAYCWGCPALQPSRMLCWSVRCLHRGAFSELGAGDGWSQSCGSWRFAPTCVIINCSSECILTSPSLFPLALPKLCFLSLKRNLKNNLLCSFVVVSIGIHRKVNSEKTSPDF